MAKKKAAKNPEISEYKGMWLFALFDLPVTNKLKRKNYARFRKELLKQGFTMFQFSVYGRYCADEDRGKTIKDRVRDRLPPEGQVRLLMVTDHQFGKMEVYNSRKKSKTEEEPPQLMLF